MKYAAIALVIVGCSIAAAAGRWVIAANDDPHAADALGIVVAPSRYATRPKAEPDAEPVARYKTPIILSIDGIKFRETRVDGWRVSVELELGTYPVPAIRATMRTATAVARYLAKYFATTPYVSLPSRVPHVVFVSKVEHMWRVVSSDENGVLTSKLDPVARCCSVYVPSADQIIVVADAGAIDAWGTAHEIAHWVAASAFPNMPRGMNEGFAEVVALRTCAILGLRLPSRCDMIVAELTAFRNSLPALEDCRDPGMWLTHEAGLWVERRKGYAPAMVLAAAHIVAVIRATGRGTGTFAGPRVTLRPDSLACDGAAVLDLLRTHDPKTVLAMFESCMSRA